MKLDRGFFGSRVARRIFGSFVIASLVPIATTAILALLQVGRVLQTRAYEQLSATTRSVGQQVLDRLLIAEEALGYVATNRGGAHPIGIDAALLETQGRIEPLFATLGDFDGDGTKDVIVEGTVPGDHGLHVVAIMNGAKPRAFQVTAYPVYDADAVGTYLSAAPNGQKNAFEVVNYPDASYLYTYKAGSFVGSKIGN